MEQGPNVLWVKDTRARLSSSETALRLSWTISQPRRHPGTRNRLAMELTEKMGTCSETEAKEWCLFPP